jgi:hypothetical protein
MNHTLILPIQLGRKQNNPGLPLVRSFSTQNRLEMRMDRPWTTSSDTQKPGHITSMIPTTLNQQNSHKLEQHHIHLQTSHRPNGHPNRLKNP